MQGCGKPGFLDCINHPRPNWLATVLCLELYYFGINKQLQSQISTVYCQINMESDMFCFVFIASAQPTPTAKLLNRKGQLSVVDALWDQTESKCCLSYNINSIFSGSCAQNNSYYISPAVFYFTTNCMSCSPVNSQTIVPIPLLIQGKREHALHEMCAYGCMCASRVGKKNSSHSSVCGTPSCWRHTLTFHHCL